MTKLQKHSQKPVWTCIVVGPMPFSWAIVKKHLTDPHTRLFFIDGGTRHLEKFKKKTPLLLKSAIILGDGDSSNIKMTWKKKDQNLSDMAFFLEKMLTMTPAQFEVKQYLLVGFLGGRLDHQLFNLGEVAHFVKKLDKKNRPKIYFEEKIEFLTAGRHLLNIEGRFSIASFSKNQVKITGDCLYKADQWLPLPELSSRGLSNEGTGLVLIQTKAVLALFYS
jgi:thiamine pyrophosphokinase